MLNKNYIVKGINHILGIIKSPQIHSKIYENTEFNEIIITSDNPIRQLCEGSMIAYQFELWRRFQNR
ncbi:MAG: hypothetical protein ACUVUF_03245 [Candidatus Bathycorpusculaceae bacterium]